MSKPEAKICVFVRAERVSDHFCALLIFQTGVSDHSKDQCLQGLSFHLGTGRKLVGNWSETRFLTGRKPPVGNPLYKRERVVSDRGVLPTVNGFRPPTL